MRTYAVAIYFVLSNVGASIGQQPLPTLRDAHYSEPTDQQLEQIQEYLTNLEAQSVQNDALMVDCSGTRSYSFSGGRLIVVDYSFTFAQDAVSKIDRYMCDIGFVINELQPKSKQVKGKGPKMLAINSDHLDFLVRELANRKEILVGKRPDTKPRKLESGILPLKSMFNFVIFNPTSASVCSLSELTSPHVRTRFAGYMASRVNGYAVQDGLKIARWFFEPANRKFTKTPKGYGLIRAIAFHNGKPVIVEDRFGIPTPKEDNRPKLSSRTEIQWGRFAGQTWPIRIAGRTGPRTSESIELDATLKWRFDKQIPQEIFDPETVGKLGFGAVEVSNE